VAVVLATACVARQTVPAAAEAGSQPFEFHTEAISSTARLSESAVIFVDNQWGDIRVRNHSLAGKVVLEAAIQRIGNEPPPNPELRVNEEQDRFQIEVRFPDARLQPRTGRVDLVIFVPANLSLSLKTGDGLLQAKKTANPIEAQSTSGKIHIINTGAISARSETGAIVARPVSPGWEDLDLASESGAITAFLPGSEPLKLVARGTRGISSQWPLETVGSRHQLTRGPQSADVDRVRIRTAGLIELYEVILPPGNTIN
jgi:hypothetical protein